MKCPNCQSRFQPTVEELIEIRVLLMQDKEWLKQLGEQAGKELLK